MTAPDYTTKPLENILRERGHPYMRKTPFDGFFDSESDILKPRWLPTNGAARAS